MKSLLQACLIVGLVAHGSAQTAKAVGSLFGVDFTSNNEGGCSYVGQTNMQSILQDSYDLAQMGVTLTVDYSNNVAEARRLLDSFFQVASPPMTAAQLTKINTIYTTVSNWIANGGSYNGGQGTNTPYLFCYHNWLQRQTMGDDAKDVTGETFPNVYTGTPAAIKDVPEYVTDQQDQRAATGKTAYPYWSYKHYAYIFDGTYGGVNKGYCSVTGNEAATQHVLNPSSLTLCPQSFGASNPSFDPANGATINYVARRSVSPNPILSSAIKSATKLNQDLSAVTPTAVTMFHELFHLILGNDVTYPDIGEIYGVLTAGKKAQIVGLDLDTALTNPESFALAAVAYDYTLNWATNSNGQRIEFYTGWTTQG